MNEIDPNLTAQRLLQPILDCLTGTDGGISFVQLRHDVLPAIIDIVRKNPDKRTPQHEILDSVYILSGLCQHLLQNQNESV